MNGTNVTINVENTTPSPAKVALITGGARRVGAAITKQLHSQGYQVMIHYRASQQAAETLKDNLNEIRPDSAATVQADLLDIAHLPNLIAATIDTFGQLNVLVNNASTYYATQLDDINEEHWLDLVGSNLKAPLFLSKAAAEQLQATKGCIINITDMHIERPKKGYIIYSVAKAGLVTLTKSLAHELSPNVRVNAVAPGPVQWPENNIEFDEDYRQRVINQTMLKRTGTPEDIAKAVNFLVNDAPFVTGHILAVDGGRSLNL